jgi:MinD-like ATPase involved in chromosome partitioning or flagellar assembly
MLTVYNRIHGDSSYHAPGIPPPVAYIPEDPAISEADLTGQPIVKILPGSPAKIAVDSLAKLLIRRSGQH